MTANLQPRNDLTMTMTSQERASRTIDHAYARSKLETLLRDLDRYTGDEFWRAMSRIASGATGSPHAEELAAHGERLAQAAYEVCNDAFSYEGVSADTLKAGGHATGDKGKYPDAMDALAKAALATPALTRSYSESMADEYTELESVAKAASKGPWRLRSMDDDCFVEAPGSPDMPYRLDVCGDDYTGHGEDEQRRHNCTFIAAADPDMVLHLIDQLRAHKR